MTIQEQIASAKKELFASRECYFAAKTRPVKRVHAEEIEFWGNKLAALEQIARTDREIYVR